MAEINKVVEWLYEDGENASKQVYADKLKEFKKIGEPVKARHFYYGELNLYFEQFQNIQNDIVGKL